MNKYIFKKYIASFLAMAMVFSLFAGLNKAEADSPALNVNASGAILVDGQTGEVLYEKNADAPLGIASMSKMMTEYLLLDSIQQGKIKWTDQISVDDLVYKISQNRSLSNVPLRLGGQYNVRELYQAMAIYSANGATIALAEKMGGSEANFVKMMNDEGKKLGLKNFKFVNSTGLNNTDYVGEQPTGGPTDENVMSSRSVATLAFHLINDFSEVLKTASTPTMMFRGGTSDQIKMDNWDWMLPGLVYSYQGMDGLKTGTTDFAGYCFTGTAMRNGQRFITVVQNATDGTGKGGYEARFGETRKMLDYAFSNYTKEKLVPTHYQIKGQENIKVLNGKESQVGIYTQSALNLDILNGEQKNYKPVLVLDKNKVNKDGELTAPVKKGDVVGYLTVQPKNGDKVNYLTPEGQKKAEVPVVASEDVEKANWFILTMRSIGGLFGNAFHGISTTVKGWFKK